jgi:hypothetical protein
MPNKFRSQIFIKYKINKENVNRIVQFRDGNTILYPNRAKRIGDVIKANLSTVKWKISN